MIPEPDDDEEIAKRERAKAAVREAAAEKAVTPSTAEDGAVTPTGPSVAAASAAMTCGVYRCTGARSTVRCDAGRRRGRFAREALRSHCNARCPHCDADGDGTVDAFDRRRRDSRSGHGARDAGAARYTASGSLIDTTSDGEHEHDMEARDRLRLLSMEMELQRAWLASYLDDREARAAARTQQRDLAHADVDLPDALAVDRGIRRRGASGGASARSARAA